MIHDIDPRVFDNMFENRRAEPEDLFLAYQGNSVLVREGKDKLWYPSFADYSESHPNLSEEAQFLFTIDEFNYFLVEEDSLDELPGWVYVSSNRFRSEKKYWRSFAGVIGLQLNRWYADHKFCSRCGESLKRSEKERMLYCPSCGLTVYPTISPCVIVAVHDGDRLLMTKYANREYSNYALIAGFNEIGESLEQTVHREVMEEVGLLVKNVSYYKSQPWPFTDTLLAGFFAELDGSDSICLDENELAVGVWIPRDEIPEPDSNISLTAEMINVFRRMERLV
ncbi:MAG: NAD(+) diphosphatase [Anaerovoracaceae bacterium]